MTVNPRFLRHRDLSSSYLLNKGADTELHHVMLPTAIENTLASFSSLEGKETIGSNDMYFHQIYRLLGGGAEGGNSSSEADSQDSIFAVVILTLGLILVVESILHRLDHYAKRRAFFRETLSACYRELAILGIVEWLVHLYHVYYASSYYQAEELVKAFTNVHYLLFYTAIINAIQCFILFLGCTHQTLNWWVKTEELDLNHYIELREEFDRVKREISKHMDISTSAEETFTPKKARQFISQTIFHPVLARKYHRLLVQVRFHELRIGFIRANKLPLKFRVSEYLRLCEQEVLMRLIKVSAFAWITLMATTNLGYFVTSMSIYVDNGVSVYGQNQYFYYALCIFFVLVTCAILFKVKRIFFRIMHTTLIDSCCNEVEPMIRNKVEHDNKRTQHVKWVEQGGLSVAAHAAPEKNSSQLDLFWGRNPRSIIITLQFLQFGYAMLLSFVITYWSMTKEPIVMFLLCLVCFAISVLVMTRIVPRFILCTNIGQLVNVKKMQEVLAKHRLQEAIIKRRKANASAFKGNLQNFGPGSTSGRTAKLDSQHSVESQRFFRLANLVDAPTEKLPFQLHRNNAMLKIDQMSIPNDSILAEASFSALTQDIYAPDGSLHTKAFDDETGGSVKARGAKLRPRSKCSSEGVSSMRLLSSEKRPRTKSLSDGVTSMGVPTVEDDFHREESTQKLSVSSFALPKQARSRRKRAASEGIAAMRRQTPEETEAASVCEEAHFGKLAELVTMSTQDLPNVMSYSELNKSKDGTFDEEQFSLSANAKQSRKSSRRAQRVKSYSEGVTSMRALNVLENSIPRPKNPVSPVAVARNSMPEQGEPQIENKRENPLTDVDVSCPVSSDTSIISGSVQGKEHLDTHQNRKEATRSALTSSDDINLKEMTQLDSEVSENSQLHHNYKLMAHSHQSGDACLKRAGVAIEEDNDAKEELEPLESSVIQKFNSAAGNFQLQRIRLIFSSPSFITINVFVTMTCFFLVALRMESLLQDSGIVVSDLWFDINSSVTFWMEVSLLILVILEGLLRLYSFAPHRNIPGDVSICIVGVCGCILGGVCMSLLLISEALRPSTYGSFGSRASAGVGKIEPFTILIFLRFFYVPFGQHMSKWLTRLKCLKRIKCNTCCSRDWINSQGKLSSYHDVISSSRVVSRSDAIDKMGKERGTVIELWQIAIGLFPDIAEQYGEFSGEMLQVMLGVPIEVNDASKTRPPDETARPAPKVEAFRDGTRDSENGKSVSVSDVDDFTDGCDPAQPPHPPPQVFHGTSDSVMGGSPNTRDLKKESYQTVKTLQRQPLGSIAEIDNAINFQDNSADVDNSFMLIDPDAPLIFSIRRCERKFLPLLSSWTIVDVAMTEFELVYFEATELELSNEGLLRSSCSFQQGRDVNRNAADIATSEGMTPSLREVSVGRKIVGHVDLRCMDSVKVQRHLPLVPMEGACADKVSKAEVEVCENNVADPSHIQEINNKRWERVTDDELVIDTSQGVLYLRFLNDLEEEEMRLIGMATSQAQKSDALAWGQALGQLFALSTGQQAKDCENQSEKASCEIELVSHERGASTPNKNWTKVKTIKTLAFRGHQRRATAHALGNFSTAVPSSHQRRATTQITDNFKAELKMNPGKHRRAITATSGFPSSLESSEQFNNPLVIEHIRPLDDLALAASKQVQHRRSMTSAQYITDDFSAFAESLKSLSSQECRGDYQQP